MPLRKLRTLAALLLITTNCARAFGETPLPIVNLPDMGSSAASALSPVAERKLGDAFMRSIRQSVKLVDDPLINTYIKSLGNRLVGFTGPHPYDFSFFIVQDNRINAFAGPGGYIGANSGLIQSSESESELASVLAHEIGHVTQHHLLRSFEEANKLSLPTAAAVIAAIILGAHDPQAAEAVLASGLAVNAQSQLSFSRGHEQEADRVGIETLYEAGFDPRAMPAFFERLQQSNRYADSGAPEFLSTHPVTLSRIADSRSRAEQFQFHQVVDSLDYHLMRGRLEYLLDTQPAVRRVAQAEMNLKSEKYRNEFAQRYVYVLALIDNGDYSRASDQLALLESKDHERVAYFAARAQIESGLGGTLKGIKILRHALQLYPHDTALSLQLSEALLNSGDVQQARTILLEQGRSESANPAYYQLMARIAERSQNQYEALEAMAEYHYLMGRLPLAIEHLQAALRQPSVSFYAKSRIEDRLREFQAEYQSTQQNDSGKLAID